MKVYIGVYYTMRDVSFANVVFSTVEKALEWRKRKWQGKETAALHPLSYDYVEMTIDEDKG